MRFLNAVFWEFIQNVAVIVLFVTAVWYWARRRKVRSIGCALGGAIAGSLLIRFTEPVASGYHEPIEVTAVNIVSMSLLQVLLAAYLGTEADWSNEKTDLLLGAMAGISLAVTQGLASQALPVIGIIGHGIALAAMAGGVLLGIRKLKNQTLVSALANGALLAIATTLFISAIDYGYFLWG
jgi:hypothetical protein